MRNAFLRRVASDWKDQSPSAARTTKLPSWLSKFSYLRRRWPSTSSFMSDLPIFPDDCRNQRQTPRRTHACPDSSQKSEMFLCNALTVFSPNFLSISRSKLAIPELDISSSKGTVVAVTRACLFSYPIIVRGPLGAEIDVTESRNTLVSRSCWYPSFPSNNGGTLSLNLRGIARGRWPSGLISA